MKEKIFSILVLGAIIGCKTQKMQPIVETEQTTQVLPQTNEVAKEKIKTSDKKTEWEAVYSKHKEINRLFKTAQIQTTVDFLDSKQSYNIKADIRIEKGKQILINLRYFLLNVGKIYISPERVSYYEVITNTHYDGNFDLLQQMLGMKIDYQQVENIFLGETFFDVPAYFWETFQKNNQLELKHFSKAYTLSMNLRNNGELILQQIEDNKGNTAWLRYIDFQEVNQVVLPKRWSIETKKNTKIAMNYEKIEFDGKVNFKYDIPSKSKPIKQ